MLHEIIEADFLITNADAVGKENDLIFRYLMLLRCKMNEPLLDLTRRILRGHTVQISTGRCCRGSCVRHFRSRRCSDLYTIKVNLEFFCHHLGYFEMKPLPHLGATVVHMHRAVIIDMHQRASLIRFRLGEGNTEFHRRQRHATFHIAAFRIELADCFTTLRVISAFLKLGNDALNDAVFHLLVIGRHIARTVGSHGIVEIELADFERVFANSKRHFLNNALGTHHALRATEATECRVGYGIGIKRCRLRMNGREEIGIVAMKQRTVPNRAR